jgi:hypothetical protein
MRRASSHYKSLVKKTCKKAVDIDPNKNVSFEIWRVTNQSMSNIAGGDFLVWCTVESYSDIEEEAEWCATRSGASGAVEQMFDGGWEGREVNFRLNEPVWEPKVISRSI